MDVAAGGCSAAASRASPMAVAGETTSVLMGLLARIDAGSSSQST
jgi:hypothetical protein